MALVKTDAKPTVVKPAVASPADIPAAETLVKLELSGPSRYVLFGKLYIKVGPDNSPMVYEFKEGDALKMLQLQSENGIPVFRRWRPVKRRRVEDGAQVVSMSTKDLKLDDVKPAVDHIPKAIEIGDDDELRADGIEIGDEEGEQV